MSSNGLQLGARPDVLRVRLTEGADFYCVVRLNEDWPVGTTLTLVLPSAAWSASISGADATFNVDKDTWPTVANNGDEARLVYTNGTTDRVFAVGTVVRNG